MWNPASPTRSFLALSMAAAVAFLGSAMLLKAGRSFPAFPAAGQADAGPGVLLLAVVILLSLTGVLLLAIAAAALLGRHRSQPGGRPR